MKGSIHEQEQEVLQETASLQEVPAEAKIGTEVKVEVWRVREEATFLAKGHRITTTVIAPKPLAKFISLPRGEGFVALNELEESDIAGVL